MKIDLKDCTFVIPVNFDHNDRRENLDLIVCLIQKNFDTNIIIGEQGGSVFKYMEQFGCKYVQFPDEVFHRTKFINQMTALSATPIVAVWDADVFCSPAQIWQSVEWIRRGMAQMVYPYEYMFNRIPRGMRKMIFPHYDIGVYYKYKNSNDTRVRPSWGGAVIWDKRSFWEGGGENELFVNYGPEDVERFERYSKLGYSIKRAPGRLIHFDHHIGANSKPGPKYRDAERQLLKQRDMSREALRKEVDNWSWTRGYSPDYYLEVGGTNFVAIHNWLMGHVHFDPDRDSVIDFGGACGEFGEGIQNYTCVDYGVPKEAQLCKNYIDHDLTIPFVWNKTYDLAVSLECAEHLPEQAAETLVDSITKSSELVLFSAAVQGQGGLRHMNEQPQSYWVEKFEKRGFFLSPDQPRNELIRNKSIPYWYRQNILLFEQGGIKKNPFGQYLDYVMPINLR